ncbi:hypothetical protein [Phytoactinopolyspora mesophila]|uniref:PH domain-containing protein n=1 Tax=Phytoactinopolyspora mesophila TaxID=2650750 RepID=A0A7K3M1K8_9ACTN|nr:hypothetical protein [Phytoactinopolyspora mesophila]NDL56318.1 hypothetical protein [Phytoactinopolyspora mesophila]
MTISSRSDELLIRPCTKQYKKMVAAAPLFLIVPAVALVVREGLPAFALLVATVLSCVVIMYFYFRGVYVVLTPTEVGRSGFTSRRKMWPRTDVAAIVVGHIYLSIVDSRSAENVFLLDRAGRTIIRLRSTHWAQEDRDALVARLGIAPVVHPDLVNPPEFAKVYPKALPWYERLSFAKMVLLTFGFVILLFVVIALVVAMTL